MTFLCRCAVKPNSLTHSPAAQMVKCVRFYSVISFPDAKTCPMQSSGGAVGICAFTCNATSDCLNGQHCCKTACGGTSCMDLEILPPAPCAGEEVSFHGYNHGIQSNLDISKLTGLFFTSSNDPKCKSICTSGNLDL